MNKTKVAVLAAALALAVCIVCFVLAGRKPERPLSAQPMTTGGTTTGKARDILTRLQSTPARFVADGAHDDHVDVGQEVPSNQVIAELIGAIASDTPTKTTYKDKAGELAVPQGYLVLDMLLLVSSQESAVFSEAAAGDDALWSSVRQEFFFPPDVLRSPDGREAMRRVQAAWTAQLNAGRLKFNRS